MRALAKRGLCPIAKKFHYCANAADAAMLHALGGINSKAGEGIATADTLQALAFFLSYASWNTGACALLRASGMALRAGNGGAHLAFPRSRSRAGGYHYLGGKGGAMFNAPIRVLTQLIPLVAASAAEAELHSACANGLKGVKLRKILQDMGHPQDTTPIKAGNSAVNGITGRSMKARYLRAGSNRLRWVREKVGNKVFEAYWESAATNLARLEQENARPRQEPGGRRSCRPARARRGARGKV